MMDDSIVINVFQEMEVVALNVTEEPPCEITVNFPDDVETVTVNVFEPEISMIQVSISTGKDGLSAYELWLQIGNQGSIEDFLAEHSDKYFRFTQHLPSTVWIIAHNLKKRPGVTVTDTAGTVVVGQVEYIDDNNLRVTFSAAFSGYAELN